MSWYLAPSLVKLRAELNAMWPNRDRTSDGSIGDAAHASGTSDHNPGPGGIVRAIDIDKDGIDPWYVVAQAIKHPATQYVIFNRKIWSRTYGFKERAYTGSNTHEHHIHVSLRHDPSAYNSPTPWLTAVAPPAPPPPPAYPPYPGLMKRGTKGEKVRVLQARLNSRGYARLTVDGDFGAATEDRVRKFQKFAKIQVDGQVGPVTWKMLWVLKVS